MLRLNSLPEYQDWAVSITTQRPPETYLSGFKSIHSSVPSVSLFTAYYMPGTYWGLRTEWDIRHSPSSYGISAWWQIQPHQLRRAGWLNKTQLQGSGDTQERVPNMTERSRVPNMTERDKRAKGLQENVFNTIPGSTAQLSALGLQDPGEPSTCRDFHAHKLIFLP